MQQRILVLGNSHTQAIKDNSPFPAGFDAYWIRSKKAGAKGDIDRLRALGMAADLAPEDMLVVVWLGTLHNVAGLLNHDRPYALQDAADPDGAAELIPEAAMRAYIREIMARDGFLPKVRKVARGRVCHVMPPPPKEDLAGLLETSQKYRGHLVAELGFAPARQRLAFWKLEQRVLAEYLAELDITPIGPPPGTVTGAGFLHPDFHAADATHANADYGARLIDHIRGTADAVPPPLSEKV